MPGTPAPTTARPPESSPNSCAASPPLPDRDIPAPRTLRDPACELRRRARDPPQASPVRGADLNTPRLSPSQQLPAPPPALNPAPERLAAGTLAAGAAIGASLTRGGAEGSRAAWPACPRNSFAATAAAWHCSADWFFDPNFCRNALKLEADFSGNPKHHALARQITPQSRVISHIMPLLPPGGRAPRITKQIAVQARLFPIP